MVGRPALSEWAKADVGATAAEFALVLPGLVFLLFGIISLTLMTYTATNLHSAVEAGARYASVQTATGNAGTLSSNCTTSGSVCSYVTKHYIGPPMAISVSCNPNDCSASGCGHSVTATGTYKLTYGLGAVSVPMSASACFP
jgi:Flp pilus assembly protein TadG